MNFWIPPDVYFKREEIIMLKIFIFTCEQQIMCVTTVHPGSSFSKKRNSYCESCVALPQGPGANRKCKTFSRRSEGWNRISTMHLKCLIELSLTGECNFFSPLHKNISMKLVVQGSSSVWLAGCGFTKRSSCYFSNCVMPSAQ